MRFGLSEHTIASINAVFELFPEVEKVIIYGSRAKGTFKNGSDIDLSLIGDSINLKLLNRIELALDELMLPYTFDLSIYQQISNPEFIDHINRTGQIFYVKKQ